MQEKQYQRGLETGSLTEVAGGNNLIEHIEPEDPEEAISGQIVFRRSHIFHISSSIPSAHVSRTASTSEMA